MVLGSGSYSRSQVSVATQCGSIVLEVSSATGPPTGWSKSLGSVPSSWYSVSDNYRTLPRTEDPRVPPLKSIVLDQRRGQKVGPCLGKTTSGTW